MLLVLILDHIIINFALVESGPHHIVKIEFHSWKWLGYVTFKMFFQKKMLNPKYIFGWIIGFNGPQSKPVT